MSKRKGAKGKASQSKDAIALAEIEQVFQDFDPGETGILERESAIEAICVLGAPGGKKLVELMDPENNGFVTYDNFSDIVLRALTDRGMDDTVQQAFDLFDKEQNGQFTFEAFKKVAGTVGEDWNMTELREMFDIADKNQDGFIDQNEFMDVMERVGLS
ncbi:hypothetical protein BC943DRAFT_316191 [Umbelopsis sp. AD052]|nr:hypothetical protein BC943DRAFT_316191 [Umbelopsis sp. AD052]